MLFAMLSQGWKDKGAAVAAPSQALHLPGGRLPDEAAAGGWRGPPPFEHLGTSTRDDGSVPSGARADRGSTAAVISPPRRWRSSKVPCRS